MYYFIDFEILGMTNLNIFINFIRKTIFSRLQSTIQVIVF